METSGGGGFTGPGAAGIPVGATAVVVDILWQLDHLLSQQQLRETLVMEAWHPISRPSQAPAEASRDAITWRASTSARTQLSLPPRCVAVALLRATPATALLPGKSANMSHWLPERG